MLLSKQPWDRRLWVLSEGLSNEDKCLTKGRLRDQCTTNDIMFYYVIVMFAHSIDVA